MAKCCIRRSAPRQFLWTRTREARERGDRRRISAAIEERGRLRLCSQAAADAQQQESCCLLPVFCLAQSRRRENHHRHLSQLRGESLSNSRSSTGKRRTTSAPKPATSPHELRRARRLIVSDPGIIGGDPVFRGTRIPVHMIAELVA